MPFLKQLAQTIYAAHAQEIDKVVVVLPSKRAGIFLKKYLAEEAKTTIWSPKIYTINDLVEELSGFSSPDSLSLLFEFYGVYAKIEGDSAEKFDEFMHWGQTLLQDFNEIDQYLIPTKQFFSNLSNIKEIEIEGENLAWSLGQEQLTERQKNCLVGIKY